MSLAQRMISDVHAEGTAKLAAIEAGTGKIEEAETLAATLRNFGIPGAKASGFTGSAGVICWVFVPFEVTVDALFQALTDADLSIKCVEVNGHDYCDIHLDGLDTLITGNSDTATEVARRFADFACGGVCTAERVAA